MKDIRIISLLFFLSVLLAFSACSRSAEPTSPSEEQQSAQIQENQPTSESETENSADDSLQQSEEEPTEEELIELLDKAMNEINSLATNPTNDVLYDIFGENIEFDPLNQVIIDDITYQWTSRQYSELVDYYSQTFTGEALNWILDTRFADVDCVLYGFLGGGATGTYSKAVSIEKLEGNTYRAHYQMFSINGLAYEDDTTFSIEKTDAGYRVSDIDHRPDLLDRK